MRYILDDRGYVKYCSNTYITCENKTCTPYEGTIPDGYETIEEWVQNANIRAYKIVDGNLVFDAEEDARLQEEYEATSNTYSTIEKRIGTWTDGRPIYRRSFSGTLVNYVYTTITPDYNNNTIEIINSYGSVRKNGVCGVPVGGYVNGNYYTGIFLHSEELQLYHGENVKQGTYHLTIEFIKRGE